MKCKHIVAFGLIALTKGAFGYPDVRSEVPPSAPQLETSPEVQRAIDEQKTLKIKLIPPPDGETYSYRFSVGANPDSIVTYKKKVDRKKQICFQVDESVDGQIAILSNALPDRSKSRLDNTDPDLLKEQVCTTFSTAMKTQQGRVIISPNSTRYVVSLPPLDFNRQACIDLPFQEGQVELFWLVYGRKNPAPDTSQPHIDADGIMRLRGVSPHPTYVDLNPDNAVVIHGAVLNLTTENIQVFGNKEL